jgi:hypothetical protein
MHIMTNPNTSFSVGIFFDNYLLQITSQDGSSIFSNHLLDITPLDSKIVDIIQTSRFMIPNVASLSEDYHTLHNLGASTTNSVGLFTQNSSEELASWLIPMKPI